MSDENARRDQVARLEIRADRLEITYVHQPGLVLSFLREHIGLGGENAVGDVVDLDHGLRQRAQQRVPAHQPVNQYDAVPRHLEVQHAADLREAGGAQACGLLGIGDRPLARGLGADGLDVLGDVLQGVFDAVHRVHEQHAGIDRLMQGVVVVQQGRIGHRLAAVRDAAEIIDTPDGVDGGDLLRAHRRLRDLDLRLAHRLPEDFAELLRRHVPALLDEEVVRRGAARLVEDRHVHGQAPGQLLGRLLVREHLPGDHGKRELRTKDNGLGTNHRGIPGHRLDGLLAAPGDADVRTLGHQFAELDRVAGEIDHRHRLHQVFPVDSIARLRRIAQPVEGAQQRGEHAAVLGGDLQQVHILRHDALHEGEQAQDLHVTRHPVAGQAARVRLQQVLVRLREREEIVGIGDVPAQAELGDLAQVRRRAPGGEEQQSLVLQELVFRILDPLLRRFANQTDQRFDRLAAQPRLLVAERGHDPLQDFLRISVLQEFSLEELHVQLRIVLGRGVLLLEGQLVGKDVAAAAHFRLLQAPRHAEAGAGTAARAGLVVDDAHVVRQDGVAGIGVRDRGDEFELAFPPGRQDFVGHDVPRNHAHVGRGVLAAAGAVGIVQAHLLREAVNINDIHRLQAKAGGQLLVEERLVDLLALELLPAADVDDLGALGQGHLDALRLNGLQDVLVHDVGETEHHDRLVCRDGSHVFLDGIHIEVRDAVFRFQEVAGLGGEVQVAGDGREAGAQQAAELGARVDVHHQEGLALLADELLHHLHHRLGLALGGDLVHHDGARRAGGRRGLQTEFDVLLRDGAQPEAQLLEHADRHRRDVCHVRDRLVRVEALPVAELMVHLVVLVVEDQFFLQGLEVEFIGLF